MTVKPTVITVRSEVEEQKETSEFSGKYSTTEFTFRPTVRSKTTKPIQLSTQDLNTSFQTQVKEFFRFSKRSSVTPGFSSIFSTQGVTPPTLLHVQVKEPEEKDIDFGVGDSTREFEENIDVSGHTDFFTQKDNPVEQGDRGSFEDTNVNEMRHKKVSENEQEYFTKYYTTTNRRNKEFLHSTYTEGKKYDNEKHEIQNDMTGWTTTAAPSTFHKEFLESSFPRKSSVQMERSVNRVPATSRSYHKVTLPSLETKPYKLEEIRLFSKNKLPHDVENQFRLEKNNTVVVKTIRSSKDEKSNSQKEFSDQNFDRDIVHANNVENDEDINNNIRRLPITNISSPLITRQQWHSAPRTILNVTDSSSNYRNNTKELEDGTELGNYLLPPQSLRKSVQGKFDELAEGNKNIDVKWSDQDDEGKFQSLVPFNVKSLATAQFQTGKEYISLIDEDVSVLPLTTTTTTTAEPRSTRKPETFTIGGLLLKGKGDFYQTIGRNPKPILVTPPVTPDKRRTSVNAKEIKSVTWQTMKPPEDLVLNSETKRNNEVNEGKHFVKEAKNAQQSHEENDRYEEEHRNVLDSTIKYRHDQHKTTDNRNKEIFRSKNIRRNNLKEKTVVSKPTTTLPPHNTAIVQKEASNSNKDIMWGTKHPHFCPDIIDCTMKKKSTSKKSNIFG